MNPEFATTALKETLESCGAIQAAHLLLGLKLRINEPTAAVMAVGRAMLHGEPESTYEVTII